MFLSKRKQSHKKKKKLFLKRSCSQVCDISFSTSSDILFKRGGEELEVEDQYFSVYFTNERGGGGILYNILQSLWSISFILTSYFQVLKQDSF